MYTATTTNATNKLTATPVSSTAEVEVVLGEDTLEAGDDGKYVCTWVEGENVLTITVTDEDLSKEYTITVTAS